jgi:hypothetical protein
VAGLSGAMLLITPIISNASSDDIQALKKQITRAEKVVETLKSFNYKSCAYANESTPTKKEIIKCKREVNKTYLKVRTPLRGLPTDEIDGITDFANVIRDCRRNICKNVPKIIKALEESIGSVDDEESFIGFLQMEIEDLETQDEPEEIIDPLFKSTQTGTKGIVDPAFKPTDADRIIDPLFKSASTTR